MDLKRNKQSHTNKENHKKQTIIIVNKEKQILSVSRRHKNFCKWKANNNILFKEEGY